MREVEDQGGDLIDLGLASEVTLGIPERFEFEELNGDDWKD